VEPQVDLAAGGPPGRTLGGRGGGGGRAPAPPPPHARGACPAPEPGAAYGQPSSTLSAIAVAKRRMARSSGRSDAAWPAARTWAQSAR
jgi:hypothetical protein